MVKVTLTFRVTIKLKVKITVEVTDFYGNSSLRQRRIKTVCCYDEFTNLLILISQNEFNFRVNTKMITIPTYN